MSKSFERLQFLFQYCLYVKTALPKDNRIHAYVCKESPNSKCFWVPCDIRPRGTTFEFEYLHDFESEFVNNVGHESGIRMSKIHVINQRQKISCYCPLKSLLVERCPRTCWSVANISAKVFFFVSLRTKTISPTSFPRQPPSSSRGK